MDTARSDILKEALYVVSGREETYGSPEDNFKKIADLWSAYLERDISSTDVAMLMALLKIARIETGSTRDSFVDLAGYAACGYETWNKNEKLKENNNEGI